MVEESSHKLREDVGVFTMARELYSYIEQCISACRVSSFSYYCDILRGTQMRHVVVHGCIHSDSLASDAVSLGVRS